MTARISVLCMLLLPGLAQAQAPAERFLSADTQIYLRWDGLAAQRDAFQKTALSRIIYEEFGPLMASLKGNQQAEKAVNLFADLAENGFVYGAELTSVEPPEARVTLVLPRGAKHFQAILEQLNQLAALGKKEIEKTTIDGKVVYHSGDEKGTFALWVDDGDVVAVAGNGTLVELFKRLAKQTPLTKQPLFQQVHTFKDFPTSVRGFADVGSLLKLARTAHPMAGQVIDDLGLADLKGATLHLGFDGPAIRTVVTLDAPGPRKGLLKALTSKPFTLADLPPLPPDITSFSATQLNLAALYDMGLDLIDRFAPEKQKEEAKKAIATANEQTGIDIRKDLLGNLGERIVDYNSRSEGPMFMGLTLLVQVKDPARLEEALGRMAKNLADRAGQVSLKTRDFHGVKLHMVNLPKEAGIVVPTYAIHKDWLVIALYPQLVQGFVLRSQGELPAWKPDAETQAALKQLPAEVTSLSMADPRRTIASLWSWTPLAAAAIRSNVPGAEFDVDAVPNTFTITRHLFPNVSFSSDDGKTFRWQNRSSVPLAGAVADFDMSLVMMLGAISSLGQNANATFEPIKGPPPPPLPPPKKP